MPSITESGRAKYTYSKRQVCFTLLSPNSKDKTPSSVIITISPGFTSRTNSASIASKEEVSLAKTQPFFSFPKTNGRMPRVSRAPIKASSLATTKAKEPCNICTASVRAFSKRFLECFTINFATISASLSETKDSPDSKRFFRNSE